MPASIVMHDDEVVAFLDAKPLFKGHVLVVPRAHVVTLAELPAASLPRFFGVVQRLSRAVRRSARRARHVRRAQQRRVAVGAASARARRAAHQGRRAEGLLLRRASDTRTDAERDDFAANRIAAAMSPWRARSLLSSRFGRLPAAHRQRQAPKPPLRRATSRRRARRRLDDAYALMSARLPEDARPRRVRAQRSAADAQARGSCARARVELRAEVELPDGEEPAARPGRRRAGASRAIRSTSIRSATPDEALRSFMRAVERSATTWCCASSRSAIGPRSPSTSLRERWEGERRGGAPAQLQAVRTAHLERADRARRRRGAADRRRAQAGELVREDGVWKVETLE